MKRLLWLLLVLPFAVTAYANESAQGWCERGAVKPVTQGLNSATNTQGSYPQCTVTVYNSGTVTPATIYSDNATPPTVIPGGSFTASTLGHWQFYGANGIYDVVLSGSGFPSPLTLRAVSIGSVTLDCAKYPGANAGVKIANCIAGLPAAGGVANAMSLTGSQTITANFFSGVTKSGTLLIAGQFTSSVCLTIPNQWEIAGLQGVTRITFTGSLSCGLGSASDPAVGIYVHDLQIFGGGGVQYGIDLKATTVGSDCYNKVGPNLNVEGTTVAAVRMDNCGGSSTYLDGLFARNLTSGACVRWDNAGGNTTIYNVGCPAGNSDTFGSIQASGQIVSIANSTYQGFVGTAQIPSLLLVHDYIYPTPGASLGTCVRPKSGSNMNLLTVIGGYCTGSLSSDSYVDGQYGTVTLLGTSGVSGASVSNFFGTSFGGISMGSPLAINAIGVDLTAGGSTVTWNPPSTASGTLVNNFGVTQTGSRLGNIMGILSVGANPTGVATNHIEVHDSSADSFILLDNTNASPSQWIIDASAGDLFKAYNNRSSTGVLQLDPGTTASGSIVQILRGYFVPPAVLFANLGAPVNGRTAMCSDCKNVGDGVTAGAVCVNGGTGAMAIRESGNWRCF